MKTKLPKAPDGITLRYNEQDNKFEIVLDPKYGQLVYDEQGLFYIIPPEPDLALSQKLNEDVKKFLIHSQEIFTTREPDWNKSISDNSELASEMLSVLDNPTSAQERLIPLLLQNQQTLITGSYNSFRNLIEGGQNPFMIPPSLQEKISKIFAKHNESLSPKAESKKQGAVGMIRVAGKSVQEREVLGRYANFVRLQQTRIPISNENLHKIYEASKINIEFLSQGIAVYQDIAKTISENDKKELEAHIARLEQMKENFEKNIALFDKIEERKAQIQANQIILQELADQSWNYHQIVLSGQMAQRQSMSAALDYQQSLAIEDSNQAQKEESKQLETTEEKIRKYCVIEKVADSFGAEELEKEIKDSQDLRNNLGRPLTIDEKILMARKLCFLAYRASIHMNNPEQLENITKTILNLVDYNAKKSSKKKEEFTPQQQLDADIVMANLANLKCTMFYNILTSAQNQHKYDLVVSKTTRSGVYPRPNKTGLSLINERNAWRKKYESAIKELAIYAKHIETLPLPENAVAISMSIDEYLVTQNKFCGIENSYIHQDQLFLAANKDFEVALSAGLIPKTKEPKESAALRKTVSKAIATSASYHEQADAETHNQVLELGSSLIRLKQKISTPKQDPNVEVITLLLVNSEGQIAKNNSEVKFAKFFNSDTLYVISSENKQDYITVGTQKTKITKLVNINQTTKEISFVPYANMERERKLEPSAVTQPNLSEALQTTPEIKLKF